MVLRGEMKPEADWSNLQQDVLQEKNLKMKIQNGDKCFLRITFKNWYLDII